RGGGRSAARAVDSDLGVGARQYLFRHRHQPARGAGAARGGATSVRRVAMTMIDVLLHPLVLAVAVPLLGAVAIALAGRWPNLREGATLLTGMALAAMVWRLVPGVIGGERPEVQLVEIFPGLPL